MGMATAYLLHFSMGTGMCDIRNDHITLHAFVNSSPLLPPPVTKAALLERFPVDSVKPRPYWHSGLNTR